ncbi:type II secretion system minor pseudopilin GspK [Zoogloea sp.]|uniref:type II secretion system minor pseudopilin GspK n=1 Tax=Zoogloea sp. TaxID=49181 RepID=UPI002601A735|nr:type II secretion system minor pseudopilin GspK [Zoogloea sp.]MDD3354602.1 type II secretion system minor pseudopilin GspK [Zoogloea sp.]
MLPPPRALPPSPGGTQRGAAVILALLTVALVAGLAAATVGDLGVAMDQVIGRHDQAQARQLARGAVDWARNVLAEDGRTSSLDHPGEAWAVKIPPTPVEEGEVSGELLDLSGRFNLNSLSEGIEGASPLQVSRFVRLLGHAGVSEQDALPLAQALIDWIDPDDQPRLPGGAESSWYAGQAPPRRPPNGPLAAVAELTQVRGFTPGLVARLRPFVAALPPGGSINVNTAPPEVLSAAIEGLSLDAARLLVVERERAPARDMNSFQRRLEERNVDNINTTGLAVRSTYFLATGRARFGVSMVRMEVLLHRSEGQNWPAIVWQKLL